MTISVMVSLAHGVIRVARQILECGVRFTHLNLQTFLAGKGIAAHLAYEVPDLLVDRLVVLYQSPLGGEPGGQFNTL